LIKIHKKKSEITTDVLVNTVWVSTFLAMILTLPALGVFLAIYLVGAVVGFGLHFVALAFSDRISRFLTGILS
jgi:hypothetical protein